MDDRTPNLLSKLITSNHPKQQQQQQIDERHRDGRGNADDGQNLAIFSVTTAAAADSCQPALLNNNNNSNNKKSYGSIFDEKCSPSDQPSGFGSDGGAGNASSVADIIGSFGLFQFLVLLFSGLREGTVGYDAVIMSVLLQPEWDFVCADQVAPGLLHLSHTNASLHDHLGGPLIDVTHENFQCYQSINGHILVDTESWNSSSSPQEYEPIKCRQWTFPNVSREASLVSEWSLVCDRHWLVAAIECAYFLGLVAGNLVWGYYADKLGRRRAYLVAHSMALVFGWLAVFMPNMELFTVCRFLCAFGSIGYNIIYSIQVEIIGTKHRSLSTTLNHLGWGIGVISVPFIDRALNDYRYIVAVGPSVTLLMFPWAFWLPESSRWLMAHDKPQQARRELIRAAKFNGKKHNFLLEQQIASINRKIVCDRRKSLGDDENVSQYSLLFKNPTLVKDTLLLSLASFSGHLFYYLLTINFGYIKNLSSEANFITSGAGEWFSVVVGALLLKICSRKSCMSMCLAITSISFALQALIDSELVPSLDTEFIITANNTVGTLSSLLLIFVALIVNQEVYPTVIRQTGSSIVNTIGESGSTIAPLLIQFSRIVGPWRADLLYSLMCLLASISMQFVTKTDDMELKDT